jgi:DNA-directed RNA polymerase specialized sigma24 family protein
MDERDLLTERFERHRPHLRAVAYRVLGSLALILLPSSGHRLRSG